MFPLILDFASINQQHHSFYNGYICGIFHVAFSGGKDSQVLLDLVKKTLPKDDFFVLFGDTGMEFPDTYDIIDKTEQQCKDEGIKFERAESHLKPQQSWEMFGPPSHVLRWCCHVHKSAPQTLKLREITGLNDYKSLDFVGVRKYESIARSDYQYENYGKKQKGQYSHNPILEWTSAEIWLYIYANDIIVNAAYTKGNGRAGCLLCPMSGGTSDYLRHSSYADEIDEYTPAVFLYNRECVKRLSFARDDFTVLHIISRQTHMKHSVMYRC